jgi:hypothetical protein
VSATGRGAKRARRDSYNTPGWCLERLLDEVTLPTDGTILEPCAGNGALVRVMRARWPDAKIVACDVRAECTGKLAEVAGPTNVVLADFVASSDAGEVRRFIQRGRAPVRLVLSNPPYSHAIEFIQRAREIFPDAWVVFLLRVNFLASEERSTFMRTAAPDVYPLPNRPSFRHGTTDATEYGWFVWPPAAQGLRLEGKVRVLGVTPKAIRLLARPRKRRRQSSSGSGGKRGSAAA